jgi:hypothetical protein
MEISGKIEMAIGIIVITIFLLALTPTIASQVDRIVIDGTAAGATKWNFTGAAGALTILGLVPFIWVAAILLCSVGGMWTLAKH